MTSISLIGLTSFAQWTLFFGIACILFGWIEKKANFIVIGHAAFFILTLFAGWVVLTDLIQISASSEDVLSKPFRALAFFKGTILFGAFNILCLLLKFLKFRYYNLSLYLLIGVALFLFFMVFNIQQMQG